MNKYDGYRSYSYLEPGTDYRGFDLAPELGRVPGVELGLTTQQQTRADRLLDELLTISLHDHPSVYPLDIFDTPAYQRTARHHTGYEGLSHSGLNVIFDNFMDGIGCVTSSMGWKWDDVIYDLGMRLSDLAKQNFITLATSVGDLLAARDAGQLALVAGLEASTPVENEVDRIDMLYGFGVRQLGIAYSEANTLGSGLRERHDGGLTYFGERCVRRMNQLGIAIDISHSGDRTSLDVVQASTKPVFVTHGGARALWPSKRMRPDDVILAVAEHGGVIGIEAAPHTTLVRDRDTQDIDAVMAHFEYCVGLVGIEHVAFGPDTLFGDHAQLHHAFADTLAVPDVSRSADGPAAPVIDYVAGLENPAECFPNIVSWLVRQSYSDNEIAAVVGGNVLRVLQEVW